MSQKISDVLEVLREIRARFRNNSSLGIREIRINAVRAVAATRGVAYQTVADAYLRRLKPDIKDTSVFDNLVEKWLRSGSMELKVILERKDLGSGDSSLVRKLFSE